MLLNRHSLKAKILAFTAAVCAATVSNAVPMPVFSAESTMPAQYFEHIKPEESKKYVYKEDGDLTSACGLPTYSWMPASTAGDDLKGIIIGIHGLTLHGRRYRVLARSMAINGIGFVSMDMRGFGRNRFEESGTEKITGDTLQIDHEKSYADIVKLTQALRAKYPGKPVIALGESLGCTFCVRLAAEHPEMVDGILLSAPAVKVNPKMYASMSNVEAGLKAVFSSRQKVNLNTFLTELVSDRREVVNEMLDDPFILKELSLKDLLSTDDFVDTTAAWGKKTGPHLSVMILQGSNDHCVLPKHLTDLMMVMPSDDMHICWKGKYGHLQLETAFMRASVVDSIGAWLLDLGPENDAKLKGLEQNITDLGGSLVR